MGNPIGWKTNREGLRMTECANCSNRANENRINPIITDLHSRVEPGDIMPAGECLKCGAVVYLLPIYKKKKPGARDYLLVALADIVGLATYPNGFDPLNVHDYITDLTSILETAQAAIAQAKENE